MKTLDTFTTHYLIAALWSGVDVNDENLDANYDLTDFSDDAIDRAINDCAAFQSMAHDLLEIAYNNESSDYGNLEYEPQERAGHDFWFTRNGHGVGFWDRGLGVVGRRLSALCGYDGIFKPIDLYVGDDGKLYFM